MIGFRVTKYDPALRGKGGAYGREEWTSISDVGRRFRGLVLELAEYLETEDRYVESVRRFVGSLGICSLRVSDLEANGVPASLPAALQAQAHAQLSQLSNGVEVAGVLLDFVVRLALRELIWCRLVGARGAYVHFGYDFYMYLG